ncbi:MAG: hypothetical protein U9Q98_03015 [Bacteroidota bacterium]|nr:hypothetical protein [Bacteroidota bacterium]
MKQQCFLIEPKVISIRHYLPLDNGRPDRWIIIIAAANSLNEELEYRWLRDFALAKSSRSHRHCIDKPPHQVGGGKLIEASAYLAAIVAERRDRAPATICQAKAGAR